MTAAELKSSPVVDGLRPVFVVGNPRSGTTLVQQLLSVHSDFWTGTETLLLSHALAGKADCDSQPLRPAEMPPAFKILKKMSEITLSDSLYADLTARAAAGTLYTANLLVEIMNAVKPADNTAQRWVEKTPLHVFYLPQIWRMFPDARVVNIIRDPRDVVSSPTRRFQRAQNNPSKRLSIIAELSARWVRVIEAYEAQRADERMYSLRYEDLILEPERYLTELTAHVGVETDLTALVRFGELQSQVTVKRGQPMQALNAADSLVDRRQVWKQRLNAREAYLVEKICGEPMRRYGYAPESPGGPLLEAQIRSWAARQQAVRSLRRWKSSARRVATPMLKLLGIKREGR